MSSSPYQPHLLQSVRTALAVLYALPSDSQHLPSSAQAHEILLHFQTRNVRRKLESLTKRNEASNAKNATILDEVDYGSTWMCCLALLSGVSSPHHTIHYPEALFAAQTLVHRLRRVKMVEAMDLEMEPPLLTPPWYSQQLGHRYLQCLHNLKASNPNSFLGFIINDIGRTSEDEERLKSEWTLITLASLIFEIALATHMRPLVATLASALAVTAARIRYTPGTAPNPAPDTQPIVTMIIQAFEHVRTQLPSSTNIDEIYEWVLYTCLTALPDALLAGSGSGGGAHGSISMDPRCYAAVTMEVRSHGMSQVCQSLLQGAQSDQTLLFALCQQWAKYTPVSREFIEAILPSINSIFHNPTNHDLLSSAFGFWIAIMEAGAWTVDQVLASALLQRQEQQPLKKRQSTKSKRRQQEVLQERTTDSHFLMAQQEVEHRQETAIQVAKQTISSVRLLALQELGCIHDILGEVSGEGPVGGIVACANVCLPFIIRSTSSDLELFEDIGSAVRELCHSPSRMVRSFAAETLYELHEATMQVCSQRCIGSDAVSALVQHFFQCSMGLARLCGYPPGYFSDMTAQNDDELENERTEVRDLLRTCCGVPTQENYTSQGSFGWVSEVLLRLLQACAEPFHVTVDLNEAGFPETVIHTFSALSRPLIMIARAYVELSPGQGEDILKLSLNILRSSGHRLIEAFPRISLSECLPLSRLYNLAVGSLSPVLSILLNSNLRDEAVAAIAIGVEAAMLSLVYVPELIGPSSLRSSRFDIRGAMRTPGGEDHSGVLAVMRLATHSDELSMACIHSRKDLASELCNLYTQLKLVEQERGRLIFHGKGVLPKSRRILLNSICHLEIATNGHAGASYKLRELFENAVLTIASLGAKQNLTVDELFLATESTFDIAGFSPDIILQLFESTSSSSVSIACVEFLQRIGCFGYLPHPDASVTSDVLGEWNRFRAALFCLLKVSGKIDLSCRAVDLVATLTQAECKAILYQCHLGPLSPSAIFRQDLISEDVVPAGLFLHVIPQIIERTPSVPLRDKANCVRALCLCQATVIDAITTKCPSPVTKGAFHDPRPMVAEAWLLAVLQLMKALLSRHCGDPIETSLHENGAELTHAVQRLACDTFCMCVRLLLYPSLGKTKAARANDPGPSTDNPHMLVAMEFVEVYFGLGATMLYEVAKVLAEEINVEFPTMCPLPNDAQSIGIAIIGAAIFRAAQGGLPPWAVECMPSIFSSFFNSALAQKVDYFGVAIQMSMEVRGISNGDGELLSGRFFQSMSQNAKGIFLSQVVEVATMNTPASWKRLKSLIKQACGGKKKETDFRQRPGLTQLDALDRI